MVSFVSSVYSKTVQTTNIVIYVLIKSSLHKGRKQEFEKEISRCPAVELRERRMVIVVCGTMKANVKSAVCTSPNAIKEMVVTGRKTVVS